MKFAKNTKESGAYESVAKKCNIRKFNARTPDEYMWMLKNGRLETKTVHIPLPVKQK